MSIAKHCMLEHENRTSWLCSKLVWLSYDHNTSEIESNLGTIIRGPTYWTFGLSIETAFVLARLHKLWLQLFFDQQDLAMFLIHKTH